MRASDLVEDYLATLGDASPSTVRQRRWALGELLAHAGADGVVSAGAVMDAGVVTAWVDHAATREGSPASLPGLRARAAAARAVARHGEQVGALEIGTLDALVAALALPSPVPVARTREQKVRHLLSLASPDRYPGGVLPAVWARFCAHTHVLALTGAREDVCASLDLAAVDASPGPAGSVGSVATTDLAGTRTWALGGSARTAVRAWLEQRALLVARLQGSDPGALWVRVRPASDHLGGSLRPAGLKISDRGLRLSFTTTAALLALSHPQVAEVTVADVRAYGRSEAAAPPVSVSVPVAVTPGADEPA